MCIRTFNAVLSLLVESFEFEFKHLFRICLNPLIQRLQKRCLTLRTRTRHVSLVLVFFVSLFLFLYRRVCFFLCVCLCDCHVCDFLFICVCVYVCMSDFVKQSVLAISVIQDKKIGWEEFQIMINPPPPPKAPTPHKVTEVYLKGGFQVID